MGTFLVHRATLFRGSETPGLAPLILGWDPLEISGVWFGVVLYHVRLFGWRAGGPLNDMNVCVNVKPGTTKAQTP